MTTRPSETVLGWAAVGSRISGFHHDCASKLQGLMMALDEVAEVSSDPEEVQRAVDTANGAVKALLALINENRALAKAPAPRDVRLGEVLQRAAQRHGIQLRGEIPETRVLVAPPSFVHALALLLESIGGPSSSIRVVEVVIAPGSPRTVLTLAGRPPAESASDSIEIATWLVEREGCELYSAPNGYQLHVPTSRLSDADSP